MDPGRANVWHDIVEVARWSPSPHNTQPWRIRIEADGSAQLLCQAERLLPVEDPDAFFMMVGFGMFIECLDAAAATHGLEVEVHALAQDIASGPVLRHVADLRLSPRGTAAPHAADLIARRRTSRLAYDGKPLETATRQACSALATASGSTLEWSDDPDLVHWILGLNRDTLLLDMRDEATRREVGQWVRTTKRTAHATRDGLWSRCLGFPGWLLRAFFRRHRLLEAPGLRGLLRRVYLRSTRGSATIGWFSSPMGSPAERVAAGRMLQRVWLELTARGAYLHPFGSIITNAEANARLQRRIQAPPGATLWLVFRAGHSAEPPRSLRRSTEEVLVP